MRKWFTNLNPAKNKVISLSPIPTSTIKKFKNTTRILIVSKKPIEETREPYHLKMAKTKNHLSSYQRLYWTKKKLTKKQNSNLSQDTNAIKLVVKTTTLIKKQRRYWMLSSN